MLARVLLALAFSFLPIEERHSVMAVCKEWTNIRAAAESQVITHAAAQILMYLDLRVLKRLWISVSLPSWHWSVFTGLTDLHVCVDVGQDTFPDNLADLDRSLPESVTNVALTLYAGYELTVPLPVCLRVYAKMRALKILPHVCISNLREVWPLMVRVEDLAMSARSLESCSSPSPSPHVRASPVRRIARLDRSRWAGKAVDFPNLDSLELKHSDSEEVAALSGLVVTRLRIEFPYTMTVDLATRSALTELDLTCADLPTTDPWDLPSLRKLSLRHCSRLLFVSRLPRAPSLEVLTVRVGFRAWAEKIRDLFASEFCDDPLSCYRYLRQISLRGPPSTIPRVYVYQEVLAGFPLSVLSLMSVELRSRQGNPHPWRDLSQSTRLRELTVDPGLDVRGMFRDTLVSVSN